MAKKPIEIFKDNEQYQKYAKEWQHILFLDNWFVTFKLAKELIVFDGNELWGISSYSFENSCATITIYNGKCMENESSISRNCAELTLVHELLHLKLEYLTDVDIIGDVSQLETALKHQSLEAMAKSLIAAKYGIDMSYFDDNVTIINLVGNVSMRGNKYVKK